MFWGIATGGQPKRKLSIKIQTSIEAQNGNFALQPRLAQNLCCVQFLFNFI